MDSEATPAPSTTLQQKPVPHTFRAELMPASGVVLGLLLSSVFWLGLLVGWLIF